MFKSVDIFEARKEGYKTYRVPGITVSKNDVVLADQEVIMMFLSKLLNKDIWKMIPDMNTGRIIAVFCWKYSRVFRKYSDYS